MKRKMMTMLLAAMTMGAAAQSLGSPMNGVSQKDTTEAKPNGWPETMVAPQFPGGDEALKKYLKKNVQYPELADQYSVEGKVIMHFTVEKDGSIKNISATGCTVDRFNTTKFSQETEARQKELKAEFAKLFAKEGARVIRKMPKWTPSKINGKPVKTRMNQPIRFSISNK
jgi:protein TonB